MNMRIKSGMAAVLLASAVALSGCAGMGQSGADNQMVSDLVTERTILRAIYAEPQLSGANIQVGCVDGIVTLSGDVDDANQAAIAERVTRGVAGVTEVRNGITS